MNRVIASATATCLALAAPFAHASSCDPAEADSVDQKVAHYRESDCARKAMDAAADLFRSALTAEGRGDGRGLCNGIHDALLKLGDYRTGAWRAGYDKIAKKVDASFNEKLARFETTTCPQKPAFYRRLALKGDPWAMFRLAQSYSLGAGLPQNDDDALAWYQQAADLGFLPAQTALGIMFSDGQAFVPDYPVARQWFIRAAEGGEAEAQYRLGTLLHKGLGIPRDLRQAAEWYRKAAIQGHVQAKSALSGMYRAGEAKKPSSGP